jgi:hypothetical protein
MTRGFQTFPGLSLVAILTRPASGKPSRRPRTSILLLLLLLSIFGLHAIAISHPSILPTSWHNCADLIRNYDYTKSVVPLRGTQEMDAVQFVDELVGGQPSALVLIEDSKGQHPLDIYVFGCHIHNHLPTLTRLFQQRGLLQGSAMITRAHTLSIGELDPRLDSDAYAVLQPLQQNIFREYLWDQGKFIQVRFPGLYPVASRSEAEALQEEINHGQTLPWNDPITTTRQLARDLFRWSERKIRTRLLNNNGTIAHVQLIHRRPYLDITVTLTCLLHTTQLTQAKLWFVTGAQTKGITIQQNRENSVKSALLTIQGHIARGRVKRKLSLRLLDHAFLPLMKGKNSAAKILVRANGNYDVRIAAGVKLPNQPGVLLIENLPPARSKAGGQLILVGLLLSKNREALEPSPGKQVAS